MPKNYQNRLTYVRVVTWHGTDKFVGTQYSIRYDTRSYFNVHLKADMSRLNLLHGDDN